MKIQIPQSAMKWVAAIFFVIMLFEVIVNPNDTEFDWQSELAAFVETTGLSEKSDNAQSTTSPENNNSTATNSAQVTFYQVASITDGDTIKVIIDEKIQIVRIANINTPETVDKRKPVECMGKQASEKMTQLVSGKKVFLEADVTQQDRDRYDRLLRFVFLEDGTDVGLEMIKGGFAHSSPYGKLPHKYLAEYESAQTQAQEQQIGLWDDIICKW